MYVVQTSADVLLQEIGVEDVSEERAIILFKDLLAEIRRIEQRNKIKMSRNRAHLVVECFQALGTQENEKRIIAFSKNQLAVAFSQFDRLFQEICDKSQEDTRQFYNYSRIIRDYLHHMRPFVELLERRANPEYCFLNGGTWYSIPSRDMFCLSKRLARASAQYSKIFVDHKPSQALAVFALRQSLESRFERIIGLDVYVIGKNKPEKFRHLFHYDFIVNHPEFFDFNDNSFEFELLKPIYDWCNSIVHDLYQPFVWQLDYAHWICADLFKDGPANSEGSGWSVHGSVRIIQLNKMKEAFQDYARRHVAEAVKDRIELRPFPVEAVVNEYCSE